MSATTSAAGTCRSCGCTDLAACPPTCAWVDAAETLCSTCCARGKAAWAGAAYCVACRAWHRPAVDADHHAALGCRAFPFTQPEEEQPVPKTFTLYCIGCGGEAPALFSQPGRLGGFCGPCLDKLCPNGHALDDPGFERHAERGGAEAECVPAQAAPAKNGGAPKKKGPKGAKKPRASAVAIEKARPPALAGVMVELAFPSPRLTPAPYNVRQGADATAIVELAAIMRERGFFGSLLCRPMTPMGGEGGGGRALTAEEVSGWHDGGLDAVARGDGVLEIVCGWRRWCAASEAGLDRIRVEVQVLDDLAASTLNLIENLQREDLHPVDEAAGLGRLAALLREASPEEIADPVALLAARVKKSAAYVRQRLRLSALLPAARALFDAQKITLGHCLLLARLPAATQKEAVAFLRGEPHQGQRAFHRGEHEIVEAPTVGEVLGYLADELTHDLAKAPFEAGDTTLPFALEAATSCLDCPHRAGEGEVPGIAEGTCLLGRCFDQRLAAWIKRALAAEGKGAVVVTSLWLGGGAARETRKPLALAPKGVKCLGSGAWHPARKTGKGACAEATRGRGLFLREYDYVAPGDPKLGAVLDICMGAKCGRAPSRFDPAPAPRDKGPSRELLQKRKADRENKAREKVHARLLASAGKLKTDRLLRLALADLWGERQWGPEGKRICRERGWTTPAAAKAALGKLTTAEVTSLVVALTFKVPRVSAYDSDSTLTRDRAPLLELAKEVRLDGRKLFAEALKEIDAAGAPKTAKKKPTAAKATPPKPKPRPPVRPGKPKAKPKAKAKKGGAR